MENEEAMLNDMTKILLTLNLKYLNQDIIKHNIEEVVDKLESLDEEKEKHKYLCLSCIFGAFLGDSMGSCCEFSSPSPKNHLDIFAFKNGIFGPGEVTDDSEMAMSSAFAYMDAINEDPSKIQDIIYYYFCVWRCSGPKDIGNATSSALRFWNGQSIEETKFIYKIVKTSNWGSLANGFLMRISTFITYYYYTHLEKIYNVIQNFFSIENNDITEEIINLYFDIYTESSKNTEITHPNYENGISSAVFTLMTLTGMVTKDASKVYSLFKKITNYKTFFDCHTDKFQHYIALETQEKYGKIINEVETNNITPVYSQMGYYIHGFKLSVYNVKKLSDMGTNIEDDIYYKMMCDVCDFGGDTDTNCAIVGAMIGPLIGYKNFNKTYFDEFIRFVPYQRCQFNSAFMYIYVNYLEEQILKGKKIETNINNIQTENNNQKVGMENISPEKNNEMEIEENIKTGEKKEETEVKKDEAEVIKDEAGVKKEEIEVKGEETGVKKEGIVEKKEETEIKAEVKAVETEVKDDAGVKEGVKKEIKEEIKTEVKGEIKEEEKKNDGLKDKFSKENKHTAFKKIMEFLTKEIDI